MRDTSIEAYNQIRETLNQRRMAVLNMIGRKGPDGATVFELVKLMGRPVNEISGRVTELSKSGLIIENGKRINPDSGKRGTVWVINKEVK